MATISRQQLRQFALDNPERYLSVFGDDDPLKLSGQLRELMQPAPEPEPEGYGLADFGRDVGGTALGAMNVAGQTLYGVADLASRYNPISAVVSAGKAAVSDAPGGFGERFVDELNRGGLDATMRSAGIAPDFQAAQQTYDAMKSPTLQASLARAEAPTKAGDELRALQDELEAQGKGRYEAYTQRPGLLASALLESAGNFLRNPGALTSRAVENLPSMIVPGGIGANAGRATLAKSLTAGMADDVARAAAVKAGGSAALRAGAVIEAGAAGQQAQQQVYGIPEAELEQMPEYRRLRESYGAEEAKQIMANRAQAIAAPIAGVASLASGKLLNTGELEADIVGRLTSPGNLARRAGRTVAAMGQEFGQETFEEGSSQFAGNVGQRLTGDENADLLAGVPEAAGMGGALGLVMGGGGRLVSDLSPRRQPPAPAAPQNPQGESLADRVRAAQQATLDEQPDASGLEVGEQTAEDITQTALYQPQEIENGQLAIPGDRAQLKADFKDLGGIWNERLQAMVFPARRADEAIRRVEAINRDMLTEEIPSAGIEVGEAPATDVTLDANEGLRQTADRRGLTVGAARLSELTPQERQEYENAQAARVAGNGGESPGDLALRGRADPAGTVQAGEPQQGLGGNATAPTPVAGPAATVGDGVAEPAAALREVAPESAIPETEATGSQSKAPEEVKWWRQPSGAPVSGLTEEKAALIDQAESNIERMRVEGDPAYQDARNDMDKVSARPAAEISTKTLADIVDATTARPAALEGSAPSTTETAKPKKAGSGTMADQLGELFRPTAETQQATEPPPPSGVSASEAPAKESRALNTITVNRQAVEEDSGERMTVRQRADTALADVDQQIETIRSLIACLQS